MRSWPYLATIFSRYHLFWFLCRVTYSFNEKQYNALVNRGLLRAELAILEVYQREEVDNLFEFTSNYVERFKMENDGQEIARGAWSFAFPALA